MKNISEILKEIGLEIPEDKQADFNTAFSENYKTVNEFQKKVGKVEEERDGWKTKAEDAEKTLKGFEGVDLEKINKDLADWKTKAETTEREYKEKIAARDYNDALSAGLSKYKFSSEAAKRDVVAQIRKQNLTMTDGQIMGLSDAVEKIREADAGAFVREEDEAEKKKAKFTDTTKEKKGEPMTKEEIMSIKDSRLRQKAIADNITLFTKEK